MSPWRIKETAVKADSGSVPWLPAWRWWSQDYPRIISITKNLYTRPELVVPNRKSAVRARHLTHQHCTRSSWKPVLSVHRPDFSESSSWLSFCCCCCSWNLIPVVFLWIFLSWMGFPFSSTPSGCWNLLQFLPVNQLLKNNVFLFKLKAFSSSGLFYKKNLCERHLLMWEKEKKHYHSESNVWLRYVVTTWCWRQSSS